MDHTIFYSGTRNASSWALRAWLSLRAANVEFEEVIVDIRCPQRFVNLARVGEISPSATVPLLRTRGRTVFDSLAIMEYANDVAGGALLPRDPLQRAEARSLLAWQHYGLSGLFKWISFESAFYPLKRRLTSKENEEVTRFFAAIEPHLRQSGGPWLFGEISLADHALAPNAIKLMRHGVSADAFAGVKEWMEAILAHPHVAEWLAEADRLPHIWFDDYLTAGAATEFQISSGAPGVGILGPLAQ